MVRPAHLEPTAGPSRTDDGEESDTTVIDDEESGAVASGSHPVTKFLRIGGEQVHVYVTAWTNSLTLAEDVKTDKDVPWDLQSGDSKLFRSWMAKEKEPTNRCRYCGQGLSGRRAGTRHEQNYCRVPGAPSHDCKVGPCDLNKKMNVPCTGKGVYVSPPDGRIANPRAGRPAKRL